MDDLEAIHANIQKFGSLLQANLWAEKNVR
jgi:hypothetical protein